MSRDSQRSWVNHDRGKGCEDHVIEATIVSNHDAGKDKPRRLGTIVRLGHDCGRDYNDGLGHV